MMAEIGIDFSGGGFSAYFERHDYQIPAITEYLKAVPKAYAGYFECVSSRGLTHPILTM